MVMDALFRRPLAAVTTRPVRSICMKRWRKKASRAVLWRAFGAFYAATLGARADTIRCADPLTLSGPRGNLNQAFETFAEGATMNPAVLRIPGSAAIIEKIEAALETDLFQEEVLPSSEVSVGQSFRVNAQHKLTIAVLFDPDSKTSSGAKVQVFFEFVETGSRQPQLVAYFLFERNASEDRWLVSFRCSIGHGDGSLAAEAMTLARAMRVDSGAEFFLGGDKRALPMLSGAFKAFCRYAAPV